MFTLGKKKTASNIKVRKSFSNRFYRPSTVVLFLSKKSEFYLIQRETILKQYLACLKIKLALEIKLKSHCTTAVMLKTDKKENFYDELEKKKKKERTNERREEEKRYIMRLVHEQIDVKETHKNWMQGPTSWHKSGLSHLSIKFSWNSSRARVLNELHFNRRKRVFWRKKFTMRWDVQKKKFWLLTRGETCRGWSTKMKNMMGKYRLFSRDGFGKLRFPLCFE